MNMKYILASGSPRRKELLAKVVPQYEVIPAQGEEVTSSSEPSAIVEELSFQKASEIFHKIFTNEAGRYVVIGADTVVSYKGKILGKPKDKEDAANMIRAFAGDTHAVYTGVTLFYVDENGQEAHHTFHEETLVDVAKSFRHTCGNKPPNSFQCHLPHRKEPPTLRQRSQEGSSCVATCSYFLLESISHEMRSICASTLLHI